MKSYEVKIKRYDKNKANVVDLKGGNVFHIKADDFSNAHAIAAYILQGIKSTDIEGQYIDDITEIKNG